MTEQPPSGLRNPAGAVRGLGAAALAAEALVLLLAIVPLNVLGAGLGGLTTGVLLAFAAACVVLAGLMRRPWIWYAGPALQVALIAVGVAVHASLIVLGVLFGLVWIYAWSVRRRVLHTPGATEGRPGDHATG